LPVIFTTLSMGLAPSRDPMVCWLGLARQDSDCLTGEGKVGTLLDSGGSVCACACRRQRARACATCHAPVRRVRRIGLLLPLAALKSPPLGSQQPRRQTLSHATHEGLRTRSQAGAIRTRRNCETVHLFNLPKELQPEVGSCPTPAHSYQ
jgi:hypothetical protein